jgi:hypothetical protein
MEKHVHISLIMAYKLLSSLHKRAHQQCWINKEGRQPSLGNAQQVQVIRDKQDEKKKECYAKFSDRCQHQSVSREG